MAGDAVLLYIVIGLATSCCADMFIHHTDFVQGRIKGVQFVTGGPILFGDLTDGKTRSGRFNVVIFASVAVIGSAFAVVASQE